MRCRRSDERDRERVRGTFSLYFFCKMTSVPRYRTCVTAMLDAYIASGGLRDLSPTDSFLGGVEHLVYENRVPAVIDVWQKLSEKKRDKFLLSAPPDLYPQPVLKVYVPPPERTYLHTLLPLMFI